MNNVRQFLVRSTASVIRTTALSCMPVLLTLTAADAAAQTPQAANYAQIPINCPYAARVLTHQRDGAMTVV